MDSRPVVVKGNQVKSASGKAATGEPETRVVPGMSSSTETVPPMRAASRPVRVERRQKRL
ncbi:hypothetical protein GCM10010233_47070 [Streptomyces pseudogriseolus]|nr:hypothetical protein GCM10010233_47070 [Streptomyces gancidicus]